MRTGDLYPEKLAFQIVHAWISIFSGCKTLNYLDKRIYKAPLTSKLLSIINIA